MFNVIDVIVIAIILLSVFLGYKKGFVKTALHFVSFFIAIGLALVFYKPLAVILMENTQIDDWIIENITVSSKEQEELSTENTENIRENIEEMPKEIEGEENTENKLEETAGEEAAENRLEETEGVANPETNFLELFQNLPEVLKEKFSVEDLANQAKEEFAYQISELIMNLLSLMIIYIVVKVTLAVAVLVLDGIMQFPILKQLNEVCGMALGAVLGFIQVYIAFAVITFISSVCDISWVIGAIKASAFASVLFENNIIIHLLF